MEEHVEDVPTIACFAMAVQTKNATGLATKLQVTLHTHIFVMVHALQTNISYTILCHRVWILSTAVFVMTTALHVKDLLLMNA